jgi:STE24 endopeptidase
MEALVPLGPVPPAAAAYPIDPVAATRAYLAMLPPEAHAKSDAYFEGGYWLILWGFVVSSAVGLLLLHTGTSARMRDMARKVTRVRAVHHAVYWVLYTVVTGVLSFPWSVYTDFVREHAYGLSNMTFGAWLGDEGKGLAVGIVLGGIFFPLLYAVIAWAGPRWWLWGAGVSMAFAIFAIALAPVYVAPLFNKYEAVTNEAVRAPILSMARANGIAATDIWEFDASRQSNRVSANVSGLFGTERISLNDNLLKRCSLEEIEAVMGHEMGHYVLNHVFKFLPEIAIIIVVGFGLVAVAFERLRERFAARWKIEGPADVAGFPLIALLFGAYMFLLTPVLNTMTRTEEAEADIFGVNASGQPDGMAQVALKLSEYRKLDPGRLEEIFFYDHPSGRNRIEMAMRWKAEHMSGKEAGYPR